MMSTATLVEAVWVVSGVLGVWVAIRLWCRTNRQVTVAEAWVAEEIAADRDAAPAQAALLTAADRRRRNGGLIVVQFIFLIAGLGALTQIPSETSEAWRAFVQLGFVFAQITLVGSAWRSVHAGDLALRLLMKEREARNGGAHLTPREGDSP